MPECTHPAQPLPTEAPDYTRVPAPISTLRLTFQDGEELDIPSDIELTGLSEEDFRIAYAAFTKTQADLRGIQNPLRSIVSSGKTSGNRLQ